MPLSPTTSGPRARFARLDVTDERSWTAVLAAESAFGALDVLVFYRAAGATYLCSGAGGGATDWHANLLADPDFTVHLRNGIRADLPARATPVTDPAERRAVLAEIVADLNQPHDPGTIRPTRIEDGRTAG